MLPCLLTLHVPVQALVAIDVEDLEVDATPEDLMLSYVSGEKGKVRPWAICDVLGKLMCNFAGLQSCTCMCCSPGLPCLAQGMPSSNVEHILSSSESANCPCDFACCDAVYLACLGCLPDH